MRKADAYFFCAVSLVLVSIGAHADDTLFYGCLNGTTKKVEKIAMVPPNCSSQESLVWWNQAGPEGPIGPQGVKGDKGDIGEKGEKGDTGPEGSMGPQGIPGQQGAKGDKGDQGDTGPQGSQGEPAPQGAGDIAFINHCSGEVFILLKDGTVWYAYGPGWHRAPSLDPPFPVSEIVTWDLSHLLDINGVVWGDTSFNRNTCTDPSNINGIPRWINVNAMPFLR